MDNFTNYLLEEVIDWYNLSKNTHIFERGLITPEISQAYIHKWRLDCLLDNEAFLKILDSQYFEILLSKMNYCSWGRLSERLSQTQLITKEFLELYHEKIYWNETDLHKSASLTPEIFEIYSSKWNWDKLSVGVSELRILDMNIFLEYRDKWNYNLLDYGSLFKIVKMDRQGFDQLSSHWDWDNLSFVNNLLNCSFVDDDFFFDYMVEFINLDLESNYSLFKLQKVDPLLFYHVYSGGQPEPLPELITREISESKEIFLHPEFTEEYFFKYINEWSIRSLAENPYFLNHPILTRDFLNRINQLRDQQWWMWLSRSTLLFNSINMTPQLFHSCRNVWDWRWLSSNESLFKSKLMNEKFFYLYKEYWQWKYLSLNMNLFKSKLMNKDFFNKHAIEKKWDWSQFQHNHKILNIANNLRSYYTLY